MTKNDSQKSPNVTRGTPNQGRACCRVESIIAIDGRGQIVLPKEIREKAGIRAGDKLAVVSYESSGEVCCLSLIKVDQLSGLVKEILGPFVKDAFTDSAEV